jgi:phosphoglycerate-specific signal transduction histidine kinase
MNLFEELKQEGSSEKEAEDLMLIAKNLENGANMANRSLDFKYNFLKKIENKNTSQVFFGSHKLFISALSIFIFVIFISITTAVNAQNSLPGEPLYGVKRLTENVFKTVDPSFKGEILKRRSTEVRLLSDEKKEKEDDLKEVIEDLESELESEEINEDDLLEAKENLETAERNATGSSRMHIEDAIKKTNEIHEEIKNDSEEKDSEDVKGESTSREDYKEYGEEKSGYQEK